MSARILGAPRLLCPLCAIVILFAGPFSVAYAQSAGTGDPVAPAVVSRSADGEAGQVELLVGHSMVLNVTAPIARVSLTRPEIADAIATSTQQLLIHGKAPGSITMFVWDRAGGIRRYEVRVQRDLSELGRQFEQLFPGEPIGVVANGSAVVISGTVSSKYVIEKAAEVASGYVEKREDVVNLLRQGESTRSNQVLLRVRFAEISRTALTELGASFFTSALGYEDYVARTTTQQFSAPLFDDANGQKLVFSDYLNLFLFNNKEGLGTVIRALQTRGLFQSLAEPNLIAENGKEASFLAGGEYPYPAIQGSGANLAVTINFKEFGIRLNFTPTILGNEMIHLKVRPEVSSLDFSNAVSYQGFRIPSLSTRRAETELELQNGQTFAIAGLLNNTVTSTMQKIPGIGDIPILGLLFRSKAAQKAQSELVVMITPQILPRGSQGVASSVPNLIEPYLPMPPKVIPPPPPYVPDKRTDENAARPSAVAGAVSSPARVPGVAGQAAAAASVPATAREVSAPPAPPPDPKELERQAKAEKERQEAEARALAKRQEEERKLREAEEKRAAEEAKRLAKLKKEQEKAEKKRAEEEAKRLAKLKKEQEKAEKKRAEQERKEQERLAKEKAKEDAKAAALRAEAEKLRLKQIKEAEERLREAQAAYTAALGKTKPIKQ